MFLKGKIPSCKGNSASVEYTQFKRRRKDEERRQIKGRERRKEIRETLVMRRIIDR